MHLKDIKFILDLKSKDKVNKYLQKGWILIDTYTESYDPIVARNDLTMHYIIGAPNGIDYSDELTSSNRFSHL